MILEDIKWMRSLGFIWNIYRTVNYFLKPFLCVIFINSGSFEIFTDLSTNTGRVSTGLWSGWEPHKVLSNKRGDGITQGWEIKLWLKIMLCSTYNEYPLSFPKFQNFIFSEQGYNGEREKLGRCEQVYRVSGLFV